MTISEEDLMLLQALCVMAHQHYGKLAAQTSGRPKQHAQAMMFRIRTVQAKLNNPRRNWSLNVNPETGEIESLNPLH